MNTHLPSSLTPGTIIGGHYIIDALLNSGGFGAVYRGIDMSQGNRLCALKETYDVKPPARRRALMEVGVLCTVKSPHLPEVYDAFESNGRFYLVMQLIEGQNLLQLLRSRVLPQERVGEREPYRHTQGPCTVQEVLNWLLPIMEVLQDLHSRRPPILHRDIKPANILLTPQQTAVLVDFGLTKLYDPTSTQTMTRAVTEGFSPVEQYLGTMSPRSDIYAMAATLYLLLTNRLPPAATRRVPRDELLPPRAFNPTIPLHVEQALLKGLAVDAAQRYQSMAEFAQALQDSQFDLHNDPTLAVPPVGVAPAPMQSLGPVPVATSAVTASMGITPAAVGTAPAVAKKKHRGGARPQAAAPVPPQPVIPPGYVVVPRSALAAAGPLPSPFGQGCLWGIIQGVLAALLLLFLKKEVYFYLGILMGFLFYVIAGLTTTWKGGTALRGAWAGMWAGVSSTITFWFVLVLGTAVLVAQRVGADLALARREGIVLPPNEIQRVWALVFPSLPNQPLVPGQTPATNTLIWLVSGLVVSWILGWIAGIFASSRRKVAPIGKYSQYAQP